MEMVSCGLLDDKILFFPYLSLPLREETTSCPLVEHIWPYLASIDILMFFNKTTISLLNSILIDFWRKVSPISARLLIIKPSIHSVTMQFCLEKNSFWTKPKQRISFVVVINLLMDESESTSY